MELKRKLSDQELSDFIETSEKLIELKKNAIKLYEELQDAVVYEHSEYEIHSYNKRYKSTYVLRNKKSDWLKEGTYKEIIKYMQFRNININKVFIRRSAKEFKNELKRKTTKS